MRWAAVGLMLLAWGACLYALGRSTSPTPEAEGAAPGLALVSVDSTPPGASVRIAAPGSGDAFGRGITPCDLPVAADTHPDSFLLHIEKPGYQTQEQVLALAAGESRALDLALKPVPNWKPIEKREQANPVTIAAVGDILLGAVHDPFGDVGDLLRAADVTFGNLECVLTTHPNHTPGKTDAQIAAMEHFVFKAHPRWANALALAGFDVVSMANNHAMDYRSQGLLDSIQALDPTGVKVVGAGPTLAYARSRREITVGKTKVGFLAVTTIVPNYFAAAESSAGVAAHPVGPMQDWLRATIEAAGRKVDVLCVSFHWGIERETAPAAYQRQLARAAVDAGADFVIGHHPHCLQPIEVMDGALVVYSLGNFVGLGTDDLTRRSVILKASFADGKLAWYETYPVDIIDHRPQLGGPGERVQVTPRRATDVLTGG